VEFGKEGSSCVGMTLAHHELLQNHDERMSDDFPAGEQRCLSSTWGWR